MSFSISPGNLALVGVQGPRIRGERSDQHPHGGELGGERLGRRDRSFRANLSGNCQIRRLHQRAAHNVGHWDRVGLR